MNPRRRQVLLAGGLGVVLLVRWLDPLGTGENAEAPAVPVSAAIERPGPAARTTSATPTATTPAAAPSASHHGAVPAWPVRGITRIQDEDLFASRAVETARIEAARRPPPPPPPPPYVPPPPPPPPDPADLPPNVNIIGTWGQEPDMRVFLGTPQGTLLVKQGDTVLSNYQVQRITKHQLTLVHQGNQKAWRVTIPSAPSEFKTWPGR